MTKFDYFKINCYSFETCLKQKLSLGDDFLESMGRIIDNFFEFVMLSMIFFVSSSFYCKLVKVRTLCILCNNWSLFVPKAVMPNIVWRPSFYTSLVEFFLSQLGQTVLYKVTETERLSYWIYLYNILDCRRLWLLPYSKWC